MEKLNRLIAKYGTVVGFGVMIVGVLVSSSPRDAAPGVALSITGLGLVIASRMKP